MEGAGIRSVLRRKRSVLAVVGVAIVAVFGFLGASNSVPLDGGPLTWGPVQSRTIQQVIFEWLIMPGNPHVVLGFYEPSGSVGSITTNHDCGYRVGDTVQYRISSVDYTIGTERSQLVNGPSGCLLVPNGT